jgi:hypothetical protein
MEIDFIMFKRICEERAVFAPWKAEVPREQFNLSLLPRITLLLLTETRRRAFTGCGPE